MIEFLEKYNIGKKELIIAAIIVTLL